MERDTVKVVSEFKDFVKYIVNNPKFPIKTISQLLTLSTMYWLKLYDSATDEEKKIMVEDIRKLKNQAEKKGYLHNSREVAKSAVQ